MKVVARSELAALTAHELIAPMRQAFVSYSAGRARIAASVLPIRGGDVHSATAEDAGAYCLKVASWVPDNAAHWRSVWGAASSRVVGR